jgi:cytidylate kinase
MAIITISRGTRSGGEALAQCLGAALAYPTLSHEVLVEAAAKLGIAEEELLQKVQKRASLWARLTEDRRIYLIAFQAALAEHCLSGSLVYHGYAGHMLLKSVPGVLKVRLIAPMETRIHALMEQENMNYGAARELIQSEDRGRCEWMKFAYGVDWGDPALYDVVINLGQMDTETACKIVSAAATLRAYSVTDALKQKLADFALGSKVKLALAANRRTRNASFEVRADRGMIEVFADVPSSGVPVGHPAVSNGDILAIARAVEGVKEASVSVHPFAASA